jgi:hypothetical protein
MAKRVTEVPAAYEAEIIAALDVAWLRAMNQTNTDDWWQRLEHYFYYVLAQRRTKITALIVKWADAGCPASNRALWRYIRHVTDRDRFNDMLVQVRAYVVRASPDDGSYPQGRPHEYLRNIWITLVMAQVSAHTGIPATRGGATTTPSIAYFLSRAMTRRGTKLGEREINRIYGERHKVIEAIEDPPPPAGRASNIFADALARVP